MNGHYFKKEFAILNLSVVALEVLAFIIFFTGAVLMVAGVIAGAEAKSIILLSLSAVAVAFVIFAMGEFLELLMRIELNTRLEEKEMRKLVKGIEKDLGKKIARF